MSDIKNNMVDSKILLGGWIVCGVCGHKLARLEDSSDSENFIETVDNNYLLSGKRIIFKCHSCKTINAFN